MGGYIMAKIPNELLIELLEEGIITKEEYNIAIEEAEIEELAEEDNIKSKILKLLGLYNYKV